MGRYRKNNSIEMAFLSEQGYLSIVFILPIGEVAAPVNSFDMYTHVHSAADDENDQTPLAAKAALNLTANASTYSGPIMV